MSASALEGVFTEYALSFPTPGAATGTDALGNPTRAAGTPVAVKVWLKPTRNPQLLALYGADDVRAIFRGRCVSPTRVPAAVPLGAEAALTYAGRPGRFRLESVKDGLIPGLDDELGAEVAGTWRSP